MSKSSADAKIGRVASDLPESCVPEKDPDFVPFGCFKMLSHAISSKKFFCWFIAGESGNGKTTFPEQACAQTKREIVTAQITNRVTESDLIGDFRLVDGDSLFYYGPVAEAMKRGAVLLLDELTQGDAENIMCLQPVLGGKPLFIKKTGEVIYPKDGFCIVATGNSVGDGDESENQIYVGEKILNEAFKDRFTAVINHGYAPPEVENKILMNKLGKGQESFASALVQWANLVRDQNNEKHLPFQITMRRLLHVVANYKIVNDKSLALRLSVSRFNDAIVSGLISSYCIIDPTLDINGLQDKNSKFDMSEFVPKP